MLTDRRLAEVLAGWGGWVVVGLVVIAVQPGFPPFIPRWHAIIIAIAIATQCLPVFAVLGLAWPVPRARYWIAIWALVFFLSDLAQMLIAQFGQNMWWFAIANPIEDAALLMAISYWQVNVTMRRVVRIAIPVFVAITFALVISFNEVHTFKVVSAPIRLLALLCIVTYTMIVRISREETSILQRDWLWTSLGVTQYYAAYVVVDPISAALYPQRPDLARLVYVVKGAVDTVAYLMVWKGMRCPVDRESSASISAPSSLSPSS